MKDEEKNLLGESSRDYIKQSFELKNLKLYKEAIEMLYKALGCSDVGDGALEIVSQIGDLYYILKNYDRAIDQYEKALEINKTHAHSLFQLCEIYFIQKKFDLALGLIKELCKNAPELENYVKYFKILYELNLFNEINELYMNLDYRLKDNPEILYIISFCEMHNKKELLEKIIQTEPNDIQAKFDLAIINFEEKDYDRAYTLFMQIIQKQDNATASYYLGLIESIRNNFSNSITHFLNAVKGEPTNSNFYFELSKSYIETGWLKEAQLCVQKSIELSPESENKSEKFYILGWINWQNNDTESALLNLEQVSENSSFKNDAMVLKNIIRLQSGNLLIAKRELENLYAINNENPILLSALGKIYKELPNIKKAIEIYEHALSIFPSSVDFTAELIDLLIDDKNYERAFELAQNLKNVNKKAIYAYNSLARIHYRKKEYEEALGELKELVKIDINNAESYYFMGLILNDLNRPKEAVGKLKTAILLSPNAAKYYFQLSRANELDGNLEDAFLYAKEACLLMPQEPSYSKAAYELAQKNGLESEAKFYKTQLGILEKKFGI